MADNDFLPFATGAGANVEGQAAYAADSMRTAGNQRGVAISSLTNKALRQGTFGIAAVSEFIKDILNENVKDNGDVEGYEDQFQRALKAYTLSFTREALSANRHYYVSSTTGIDTNDGLTVDTPWATLQKAWDTIQSKLDLKSNVVTVHVADGDYTAGTNVLLAAGAVVGQGNAAGSVQFIGNVGTPSLCLIHSTSQNAVNVLNGAALTLSGFKLSTAGAQPAGIGINCSVGSQVYFKNIEFGICPTAHMTVSVGSQLVVAGNYSITGSAYWHYRAHSLGNIFAAFYTATLSSGLTFLQFAQADSMGVLDTTGMSFARSGEPVGSKYIAVTGMIHTQGSGPDYFPGADPGTGLFYF